MDMIVHDQLRRTACILGPSEQPRVHVAAGCEPFEHAGDDPPGGQAAHDLQCRGAIDLHATPTLGRAPNTMPFGRVFQTGAFSRPKADKGRSQPSGR